MSVRYFGDELKNEVYGNLLEEDFEDLCKKIPINKQTECGFFIFKGSLLQKLASKKVIICIHGIVGCIYISTFAYYNGVITTFEKRFNIPSKNAGIIAVGYDLSSMITAPILSHFLSRRHRPRWISFGILTVAIYCFLVAGLHLIYGSGEDALMLTTEYGANFDKKTTKFFLDLEESKKLCELDPSRSVLCDEKKSGSIFPQLYLFCAQFLGGLFGPLYDSLGVSYMDDNIQKSKTPVLISISYFIKMFGPAFGYTLASFSLSNYIAPTLTPIITSSDPRWIGAWWFGYIILGCILLTFSLIVATFPRELQRASVRRMISVEREKLNEPTKINNLKSENSMKVTFKRVLTNKIYIMITLATVCNFFGSMAFWIFTPKYIETQYRQSASRSSFLTGSVALVFTALGILVAGMVITKFKPSSRYMAGWNVIVSILSALSVISYIFLGCTTNENSMILTETNKLNETNNCHCDYVNYYPVCGENNVTYISPCHAGCLEFFEDENGVKSYKNCLFIDSLNKTYGNASLGWCPVDCSHMLYLFMIVMCFYQFIGASGRTSNFLISVRSVEERDKAVAMGIGLTIICLFAFIPSPVFFGWLIDQTCSIWGKTCEGTGNCWLYDKEMMRYYLNSASAFAIFLGALCDFTVWCLAKDLKLFDDDDNNNIKTIEINTNGIKTNIVNKNNET